MKNARELADELYFDTHNIPRSAYLFQAEAKLESWYSDRIHAEAQESEGAATIRDARDIADDFSHEHDFPAYLVPSLAGLINKDREARLAHSPTPSDHGVNNILCLECTTPHHDHYVCGNCGVRTTAPRDQNYCSYCGARWRDGNGKLIIHPSQARAALKSESKP
jgi:hypothetical protein